METSAFPIPKIKIALLMAAGLLVFPNVGWAKIDLNADGLDDVWQEYYGAQGLVAGSDEDGDEQTNLEECLAGTDPFDPSDFIQIDSITGDGTSTKVSWLSEVGKLYRLLIASDIQGPYQHEGTVFYGTGEKLTVEVSASANTTTIGAVSQEVWTDLPGFEVADLTTAPNYPASPNAMHSLARFEIIPGTNDDYGGRIRGYVVPPESGSYTFYLSSRGESMLYLSPDDDPANKVLEASISGNELGQKLWDEQGSQASAPMVLQAGERYYVEVVHKHGTGKDHCAVGWEGPGITADAPDPGPIQVIGSEYVRPFFDGVSDASALLGSEQSWFRVVAEDLDSDGDNLTDWAEKIMGGDGSFSFADSSSTATGSPDFSTVLIALLSLVDSVEITTIDGEAVEDFSPAPGSHPGSFRIVRRNGLQPVAVNFNMLPGPLAAEGAEPTDYSITDGRGNVLSGVVVIPFGKTAQEVMIHPVNDFLAEYPEGVRMELLGGGGAYNLGASTTADLSIIDARDLPGNETLFAGVFSEEPSAGVPSSGTGFVSASLNGPKTQMVLYDSFFNLTSPQNDSHVHKANAGPMPGPIVYEITNTPGDPVSNPFLGPIGDYPWDIEGTGGFSAQDLIDSLFGQNGESKLYLNVHTNQNPVGEIWAFLNPVEASITPPDPPPPPPPVTLLSGEALERDCWRFLNQATFGATKAEVDALVVAIETARMGDPSYSRLTAFEDWIDAQVAMPQTYVLDLAMAELWEGYKLRGYFDQSRWTAGTAPPLPTSWPSVDRSDPDFRRWFATERFPISHAKLGEAREAPNRLSTGPAADTLRHALWTVMLNSKDQLRQRVGFALQQINVVSTKLERLESAFLGTANYQDQINHHAFGHYRDVLDWVAWSPQMAKYLSSLKNQRAFDLDGDMLVDVFPDENLAREIMQLFSVGLFELFLDGSLVLDPVSGLPRPTYDNTDITELARIFTGQSFSKYNPGDTLTSHLFFGSPAENFDFFRLRDPDFKTEHLYKYPLKMFGAYHDTAPKVILGGKVIDNTHLLPDVDAMGVADLSDMLDWLGGIPGDGNPDFDMGTSHRSTPAFISRRLIQRMVTSNPPSDYLFRVASVFQATEGDLLETVKAILLDYHARDPGAIDLRYGHKKSPLIAYMQFVRALGGHTHLPIRNNGTFPDVGGDAILPDPFPADVFLTNYGYPVAQANNFELNSRFRFGDTEPDLSMAPMRQPSVFNFYLPDYSPAGPIGGAGLVAPEMNILHEGSVISNLNMFSRIVLGARMQLDPLGAGGDVNQRLVFNTTPPEVVDGHDAIRIDGVWLGSSLYPASPLDPDPVADELLRDTVFVDSLDMMLTNGRLKEVYPYDHSDDDGMGAGNPGPNPREVIIDSLGVEYSVLEPHLKFQWATYLFFSLPEFWVRK